MRTMKYYTTQVVTAIKSQSFPKVLLIVGLLGLMFYTSNNGRGQRVSLQEDIKQISVIRNGDTLLVQKLDIYNRLSQESIEGETSGGKNFTRTGQNEIRQSLSFKSVDVRGKQSPSGDGKLEEGKDKVVRISGDGQSWSIEEVNVHERVENNTHFKEFTYNDSVNVFQEGLQLHNSVNKKLDRQEPTTIVTKKPVVKSTRRNYTDTMVRRNHTLLDDVELYLRMTTDKLFLYQRVLVQSLWYFWPYPANMVVVLDGENYVDRSFGKYLSLAYPFPRVGFMDPIDPEIYYYNGHERMQRDFFYPERHVTKKYVGYIDTDTMFVTTITPDLLFENGKPVVVALYGYETDEFWYNNTITTSRAFKRKEVMRCMTYFPVIIEVQHMVELRKYLEKIHNDTFDNIFHIFDDAALLGQFNLMCQYIWMFHRNEYSFHLEYYNRKEFGISPGRITRKYYKDILKPEETYPFPRSSIHFRHLLKDDWTSADVYRKSLKAGLCFSGGFDVCPEMCKEFDRNDVHTDLFAFELHHWLWDKRCIDAQNRHYKTVLKNLNADASKLLQRACLEVDYLPYNVTESLNVEGWMKLQGITPTYRDRKKLASMSAAIHIRR